MMPYLLVFVTPLSVVLAFALGGAWTLLPVVLLYGLVPLADAVAGWNRHNPAESSGAALRGLPVAFAGMNLVLLAVGLYSVVSGAWSPWERVGLASALGIGSAIGIAVAHELMHRTSAIERHAADALMLAACYPHFSIEHVLGHHRNVGTPDDPATSRLGESFWAFLPRTVVGGVRSAWRIDRGRTTRYAAAQALVLLAVLAWLGPLGLLVFVVQAALAVFMLENINYIEHYGLARARGADGRWERVRPEHSWNASHRITNWMIVNLARHSDHHAFPGRRFADLRHHDDVPQMPAGYSAMMLAALVPPLWFALMDTRVTRYAPEPCGSSTS